MTTLYKCRFLVEGENEYEIHWFESIPTTYEGQNIVTDSLTVLDTISDDAAQVVKLEKENIKTGEHYQCRMVKLSASANSVVNEDLSFPFPVSIFTGQMTINDDHIGDEIEVVISPNTVMAQISSDISPTDIVLNINPAHITNLFIGANVAITDGQNYDNLGRIIELDEINNTIKVETAAVHSFQAGSGIIVNIYLFYPSQIVNSGRITVGQADIAGKYLPANTIMRLTYKNNSGTPKNLNIFLEYLY